MVQTQVSSAVSQMYVNCFEGEGLSEYAPTVPGPQRRVTAIQSTPIPPDAFILRGGPGSEGPKGS